MNNLYIVASVTLLSSAFIVTILINKIRWIVKSMDLIDRPDHRSSHIESTPTMAGVSFFLTVIFVLIIIKPWDTTGVGINLIAALGLMFAVGLKDDLVVSTPRAKIISEVLAIGMILFCNCLKVSSLGGFMGIGVIPDFAAYILVTLIILTIINSFNMIDGIDGLASIIGIVIFSVYGFLFLIFGLEFYFLLCLCFLGILIGYIRFNLSKNRKIFMGDTGSLFIGFCIGFLSVKFLSIDSKLFQEFSFIPSNKLIIIAAIFFIPLFDIIRVISIRLINKNSPFKADNNHIHHVLINSGLSHFKASLFLGSLNLILASVFIFLSRSYGSFEMIGFYLLAFILLLIVFYKLKRNIEKGNRFRYLVSAIQFLF
ncbi:glycosyltransferase family 4 protein [Winogradskyella sp. PG-2]|uniref:glycosyltransferase family 4 protein n=1 Tax=Winogradskyella sp. PG-2 TaxID=754409 RepID=UPI0004588B38|nr:MraY family glycosyltransferase [Winogradskyella sp. PG-2]BAO75063.1 undecaprenyl-phosphate N-acetylglucosaminyl 1-phosphate transferase [Winogradskyella sp. PG-2]